MEFVKGNTVEKQIESIDRVLQKFSRRLHKIVTCIVPPIPMSSFVKEPDEDGCIYKYVFLSDGVVKGGLVALDGVDEKIKKFVLEIELRGGGREFKRKLELTKNPAFFEFSESVSKGDFLTVRVSESAQIGGAWTGFLYDVDPGASKVVKAMVDKLEEVGKDAKEEEG